MKLEAPITEIKGIGSKTEKLMNRIGVYTVGDILLHYPRDYVKFKEPIKPSEIQSEGTYAILGKVLSVPILKRTNRMEIVQTKAGDYTGSIDLVWFRMPYIGSQLKPGETYIFYGKVKSKGRQYGMEQPEIYTLEQYQAKMQTLQPVYGKTEGLSNAMITKTIRQVLEDLSLTYEYLPESIRKKESLCEYNFAIKQIHFPENMENLIIARQRLVFDEFFLFILQMQLQKEKKTLFPNDFPIKNETVIPYILSHLPYSLTKAQKKCFDEIVADMKKGVAMQRLVQGDVGSGKTIVAFLCMALMGENGHQSALMAPTEVLARQHYETFTKMCNDFELKRKVILLTGSLTAKQKRSAYEDMQLYPDAMIIGTQALIQEKALYNNLGLVITDEQHRFGVRQRETFAEKGLHPHILVMSATPIPRTLAIIIYGDMDISVIDEIPAKRLPNKNCVVGTSYRKTAYDFIRKEINAGHQAYVICPLVEESEELEAENVIDYAQKLEDYYHGDIRIGCLNGKMKSTEKNSIMEAFAAHDIDLLVSTTVVEVGVNVPNATVMMIENAERFGLAQLHQLRGRVGRGEAQSYCIMIDNAQSKESKKRLEILNKSNDGFFIAGEDLKLRGPGDFFGIRQSGDLAFQIADIYQDANVLKQAAEDVKELLAEDGLLEKEENQKLAVLVERSMTEQMNL
ncbi:MAG: ATP-dependent DNA helicase RecG [Lachnospiraceae bacterium]|nr:ATP-dependent DNA helicase RecG [Lachnospiraceae bacterium]